MFPNVGTYCEDAGRGVGNAFDNDLSLLSGTPHTNNRAARRNTRRAAVPIVQPERVCPLFLAEAVALAALAHHATPLAALLPPAAVLLGISHK